MTDISEMDLPDEAVQAAVKAIKDGGGARAAIRAALQAMVDCGRAKERANEHGDFVTILLNKERPVNRAECIMCHGDGLDHRNENPCELCSGRGYVPIRLSPQRKEKEQT